MLAFRHDRTDHLAAVGCNLSCESNAFQVGEEYFTVKSVEVLISLARVMLFREQTGR